MGQALWHYLFTIALNKFCRVIDGTRRHVNRVKRPIKWTHRKPCPTVLKLK